jgi:hypothetical protein
MTLPPIRRRALAAGLVGLAVTAALTGATQASAPSSHGTPKPKPAAQTRFDVTLITGDVVTVVYTGDGHMSVQVMYRNPQASSEATSAAPVQYAQAGYEASFGTYDIDELAHHFTFHVEGALVRTLIGKDLTRVYEFSGKELIVKSPSPNEHWRAAWEHY